MRVFPAALFGSLLVLGGCDEVTTLRQAAQRVEAIEQKVAKLERGLAAAEARAVRVETGTGSCKAGDTNAGRGSAATQMEINFAKPFPRPPVVTVALTGFDLAARGKQNLAVALTLSGTSTSGFSIRPETPTGLLLSDCSFSWIAFLPPEAASLSNGNAP